MVVHVGGRGPGHIVRSQGGWGFPGASIDMDFVNDRYTGVSLAALTVSRALTAYAYEPSPNTTEIVTNGTFDQFGSDLIRDGAFNSNADGWVFVLNSGGADLSVKNGVLSLQGDGIAPSSATLTLTTVVGKTYMVQVDQGGSGATLSIGTTAGASNLAQIAGSATPGTYYVSFTATTTTTYFRVVKTGATLATLDNLSVKEATGWTLTNQGTSTAAISGGLLNLTGDGTNSAIADQSIPTVSGRLYTLTFTASTSGSGLFVGDAQGGTQKINGGSFSAGVNSFSFVATQSTQWLRLLRTSASLLTFDNVSVKETAGWWSFASNVARRTSQGLLVEEARTNGVRNNSMQGAVAGSPGTLPTNWSITNAGGVTRQIVGTGTENGIDYIDVRLSAASALNGFIVWDTSTAQVASNGQVWTASTFVSLVGGSWANLTADLVVQENDGAGTYLAETDTAVGGATAGALSGKRKTATRTFNNASTGFASSYIRLNASGAYDITLRIGWPQLEQGSWATSPIRTTAAAVTRAADVVSASGLSGYGSAASVYGQGKPQSPPSNGANQSMAMLTDGTTSNRIGVYRVGGTGVPAVLVTGGSVLSGIGSVAWPLGTTHKVAIAAAAGAQQSYLNASTTVSDTNGAYPPGMNTLSLGSNGGGAGYWNGLIERIAVFSSRLSNTQLQAFTAFTLDDAILDLNFVLDTASQNRVALTSSTSALTVSRASSGYADDTSGTWTLFGSNVARRTNKGLLVEEARTNSIRNNSMQGASASATFPTNWATTPDISTFTVIGTGTEGGIDYIEVRFQSAGAETGARVLFEGNGQVAASAAQVWTGSFFCRLTSGSLSGVTLQNRVLVRDGAVAFLADQRVTITPTSAALSSQRSSNTYTLPASTASVQPGLEITSSGAFDFTVRIGWPQLEQGAFATSPIRTTSAAVTRAADVITVPGFPFASAVTTGTLYAEGRLQLVAGFTRRLLELDDGTSNNRHLLGAAADNSGRFLTSSGGVTQSDINPSRTSGAPLKIAAAYAVNDFQAAVNGTLGTPDTSGALPVSLTTCYVGTDGSSSGTLANDYIKRIAYLDIRAANQDLQAMAS